MLSLSSCSNHHTFIINTRGASRTPIGIGCQGDSTTSQVHRNERNYENLKDLGLEFNKNPIQCPIQI